MNDLLWMFTTYGLVFFVANKAPRPAAWPAIVERMLACSFCLGWWCGLVTGVGRFLCAAEEGVTLPGALAELGAWALAAAAVCYLLDVLAVAGEAQA